MRPQTDSVRVLPRASLITCGQLPERSCRHDLALDGLERPSGRDTTACGITPSTIMSPSPKGSSTEIRLGARAHEARDHLLPDAHAPPAGCLGPQTGNPDAAFAAGSLDR
jgi:hypothetical protein